MKTGGREKFYTDGVAMGNDLEESPSLCYVGQQN
jgi:hypothetical protein